MRMPPGDAGGFRDVWASHFTGIPVNANMVSIIITAVQSAVVAIENEVGTTAGRNYVRKDGAVTIIGLMTSRTGAEFGAVATRDRRYEFDRPTATRLPTSGERLRVELGGFRPGTATNR